MTWIKPLNDRMFSDSKLEGTKKILSLAAPLLALLIAYFAQNVFDTTTGGGTLQNWTWLVSMSVPRRLWFGAGLYLVSMLIWMFTAPGLRAPNKIISQPPDDEGTKKARYQPLGFILLLTSASAYIASMLMFVIGGENGLVRSLWIVGLVCFIIPYIPYIPLTGLNTTSRIEAEESPRFQWQNWLVLVLILGMAFWLRFYKLATIPDNLHGDMASYGLVARDILLGKQQDIFGDAFYDIPTMGFLPAAFSMAVFGDNIFGLQMTSVIGGILSLLAVYLLVWRLFNSHRLATLTIALLSINIPYIHFSRIAAYMDPWLFGYFALFFFIDGLKARRAASFGLAGVLLGFSLQMYFSGRVLVFIIGLFLIFSLFFQRTWIIQNKTNLVLMAFGVMVAMGPALVFHLMHLDSFNSRSREVFIFSQEPMNHLLGKYQTDSSFMVLLNQIKLSLLMFNQASDSSTQFGFPHPMFDSFISPLIVLGLGFAIRRWKDINMMFVLLWLGLIMTLGSILTVDAPFWPRLVGILPVAALLAAMALDQILEFMEKTFTLHSKVLVSVLLGIFLTTVGYLNWGQYYFAVRDNATSPAMTGRFINSLPLNVTACSITNGPPLVVRETAFLAWPHHLVDIKPDAPDSELGACAGSPMVWIISPENIGRLDAIRARWPNGVLRTYNFPRSDYKLTFYLVGVDQPISQVGAIPYELPTIPFGKNILIGLLSFGILILIWFAFKRFPAKLPPLRNPKRIEDAASLFPGQNTPTRSNALIYLKNEISSSFIGLSRWYNEIVTFKFPANGSKAFVPIIRSLAAVGLAYFAQTFLDQQKAVGLHLSIQQLYLLSESQRLGIGCLIFLVAAVLWIYATNNDGKDLTQNKNPKRAPDETILPEDKSASRQTFAAISWGKISIAFTVGAIFLYAVLGENSPVRLVWVVGLCLFLVSLFIDNKADAVHLSEESPNFRWYHVLALLFLLILAFCLRVYRLYDIPLDLSTDMAAVGLGAREYLLGLEQRIFGTGWFYMPRLSFIPYVLSMKVVGNNLFGLYFASVVMGTLNILGVYLFIWRLFDRHRLALLSSIIITINPAHIEFSRITSFMDPWFFGFFGLFFFVDGIKGRRKVSLAMAGICTGFTLLSYASGRAIVPLIAIGLLCAWLYKREWVIDNRNGLGWMALGILAAVGPNLVYFIADWSVYMQRAQEVIIFNPAVIDHLKYTYKVDSVGLIVWEQIKRSALLFNYYTDTSAQFAYPYPMFNSFLSPMLILGFGMALYRWKKLEFLFVISSFVFILVTGSVLTDDAPTWVRIVGIIPLSALLIALVLDELINLLERTSFNPYAPFLFWATILFLGNLGIVDWHLYVKQVENEARPVVRVARYINTLPNNVTACGITDGYLIDQEEIKFLGWPRKLVVVPSDTVALTSQLCPSQNVVWILSPETRNRLSELKVQWPGGLVEDHFLNKDNKDLMFTSYLISDNP